MDTNTIRTNSHRGIWYETHYKENAISSYWCSYIILRTKMIPERLRPELILQPEEVTMPSGNVYIDYKYTKSRIINAMDWHCGCTYYDVTYNHKGEPLIIKIGYDYHHYYDEGMHYNHEYVEYDIKAVIDRLIELIPDILIRSMGDGKYYPVQQVEPAKGE